LSSAPDILTLDFETFYGDGYTLSSMTTEEYVRDSRFETILCGFKINNTQGYYAVGHDNVAYALRDLNISKRAVLAHHAHFDGLILSHHYGHKPKMWLDTLGMARHVHGANAGLSLAKLATRYGIGTKGEEVINARNLRLADFGPVQLSRYGRYCVNDCDLEYELFLRLAPHFTRSELMINDQVIRMFTEPCMELDVAMLHAYEMRLNAEKTTLMLQAGVQRADLMSNDKFAQCLIELGVEPPKKVSTAWLKKTEAERTAAAAQGETGIIYAFAKTDTGMQFLQEHPDERVQILVEARLKNKTTIAEKGAQRLQSMASRGRATVYLKYSGASGTHRLSGGDMFNWQSMKRGSDLRKATMAPEGEVCIVADSSTIEARWLDWLSGQDDMVEVYRKADRKEGPDVYCTLAERIYKRPVIKSEHPQERQMGKVSKLGLGFGMGPNKFVFAVRAQAKDTDGKPLIISPSFAKEVVGIYREAHPQVKKLWKRGEEALGMIAEGVVGVNVDYRGLVRTCEDGLVLPGGIRIHYPDLKRVKTTGGVFEFEWEFWNGKMRERIYGAKVIENIIQCLARTTVFYQCLKTAGEVRHTGTRWAHSMHDEGIFVGPEFTAPWVQERLMANFRTSPEYAQTLPLNCEAGFHRRYGLAKS
jgi:DNA polymerase